METEEESPAAAYARMRAAAGWGDRKPVDNYRPDAAPTVNPLQTAGAKQPVSLPPAIIDLLQAGFQSGGTVPDSLIRMFKLHPNHSLVAGNALLARPQGPYPFVAERKVGKPTGKIRFVQHYPIAKFLQILGEQ